HVLARVALTLLAQLLEPRVALDVVRIDPGEVEPEREVDEVVIRQELGSVTRRHAELEQAAVLVVPMNDVAVVDGEEATEHVLLLLRGEQAVDGPHRYACVLVVGATRVVLER